MTSAAGGLLQAAERLELQVLRSFDPDRFTGPRIAALARRTLGDRKGAKGTDGVLADLFRLLEARLDLAEHQLDGLFGYKILWLNFRNGTMS